MQNWKVGDRVRYLGNAMNAPDTGTVKNIEDGEVWAEWDSDGAELYFNPSEKCFVRDSSEDVEITQEQQAVMLLLSLGYTITKG